MRERSWLTRLPSRISSLTSQTTLRCQCKWPCRLIHLSVNTKTKQNRIIYNFPAVSGGIDMDSDLIVDIVKASPNICGVKLTCANVGKLTRIMGEVDEPSFKKTYPRRYQDMPFQAIDGFIDFLLPSISVGSAGAISGLPNLAPVSFPRNLCSNALIS